MRIDAMRFLIVLLVGWGLGWFVARSTLLAGMREALAQWRDRALRAVISEEQGPEPDPIVRKRLARRARLRAALPRFAAGLVHCAACSGAWIGCAIGIHAPLIGAGAGGALATGVIVMGVNAVLDGLTGAASAIEQAAWGMYDANGWGRPKIRGIQGITTVNPDEIWTANGYREES